MKYTQKQLEVMSDPDINRLVADKEGVNWQVSSVGDGGDILDFETFDLLDYCNSWADMGPIIQNNQISICSFISRWRCSSLLVKEEGAYVEHKNPLRAAAIVYLMMEG